MAWVARPLEVTVSAVQTDKNVTCAEYDGDEHGALAEHG